MLILSLLAMKKLFIIALFLLGHQALAQSTIGINFQGLLPTGELKKDAPEIGGGGFGLEGIFSIKQSAFHVGGLIEYNHFGSKVREGYHGPDLEDVRVKRNFEVAKLLGVFRFKPNCGENIFPYFDLLVGTGNVHTRTNIRESFFDEAFERFTELDEWAFMYGFGFGNEFYLSESIILDVFVRTMKSTRIEYLSPDSVEFDPSTNWYNLELKSSAFNHLSFGFGLKFYFNNLLNAFEDLSF